MWELCEVTNSGVVNRQIGVPKNKVKRISIVWKRKFRTEAMGPEPARPAPRKWAGRRRKKCPEYVEKKQRGFTHLVDDIQNAKFLIFFGIFGLFLRDCKHWACSNLCSEKEGKGVFSRRNSKLRVAQRRRGARPVATWRVDAGCKERCRVTRVHCVCSGEGINTTNDKGETYLHFAAFNAEPQLVKWLIEKGADCNMQVTVMSSHHVLLFPL